MANMNNRVPIEKRLGTSRLNDVFLNSKFQELETGSDLTFMQSKKKSGRQIFRKLKTYESKSFLTRISL